MDLRILRIFMLCILALALNGCAQVLAYNQAPALDRSILTTGVDRSRVLGVVGSPIGKEENSNGTISETYKYCDGGIKNTFGSKAGRILLYTAGDVFTLCLDQVIWMPMELAFKCTPYVCDINYAKVGDRWIAREVREIDSSDQRVVKDMIEDPKRYGSSGDTK